jgi:hypothetical protein
MYVCRCVCDVNDVCDAVSTVMTPCGKQGVRRGAGRKTHCCYSGVTVLSQWCYSDVTMVLQC